MNAPRGNQRVVFIAVAGALAFAALPFISKQASLFLAGASSLYPQSVLCRGLNIEVTCCAVQVRKREQEVASMRDASYDAKDAARNARLRVK